MWFIHRHDVVVHALDFLRPKGLEGSQQETYVDVHTRYVAYRVILFLYVTYMYSAHL